jgi:hypothetical protein
MKLLVQEFLETHSFGDLIREHGIYASLSKNKKYASFNYDQIETKENDELSWDCRGLILSKDDFSDYQVSDDGKLDLDIVVGKTRVLCFGMRRFFNYGMGACAPVNWSDPNLSIQEKRDGSLLQAWFSPITNSWNLATRAVPEADLLMDNGIFTFRTLFEKALLDSCGITFEQLTQKLDANHTYCFELTSRLNRVVVDYADNGITLLAVRDLTTHLEVYPECCEIAKEGLVPTVQTYSFSTIPELLDWVSSRAPTEHEGVVVRDSNFNRIKVKNAAYVAASKMRDSLGSSPRNCLELILLGKDDDALSLLPQEIVDNLLSIKSRYIAWLRLQRDLYEEVYAEAMAIMPGDKKTFALTLDKYPEAYRAAFFNTFAGKCSSIKDFIDKAKKEGTWSDSTLDNILAHL